MAKNSKIDVSACSAEERAIIEARRRYQKEWRAKNKDKVREHNRRFWEKYASKMISKSAEWPERRDHA